MDNTNDTNDNTGNENNTGGDGGHGGGFENNTTGGHSDNETSSDDTGGHGGHGGGFENNTGGDGGGDDAGGLEALTAGWSGPELAGLLSGVDLDGLSTHDVVTVIRAWERVKAHAEAAQARALAALCEREEYTRCSCPIDVVHQHRAVEPAGDEVSLALAWTPGRAKNRITIAVELVHDLPATLCALQAGRIDADKAALIAERTRCLGSTGLRRRVEAAVLPVARRLTRAQLDRALRREVIAVDPDAAEHRRAAAAGQRRVSRPEPASPGGEDGMAVMGLYGPVEDLTALHTAIDAAARHARGQGDERSLDQLRFDTATSLGWNGLDLAHLGCCNPTCTTTDTTDGAPATSTSPDISTSDAGDGTSGTAGDDTSSADTSSADTSSGSSTAGNSSSGGVARGRSSTTRGRHGDAGTGDGAGTGGEGAGGSGHTDTAARTVSHTRSGDANRTRGRHHAPHRPGHDQQRQDHPGRGHPARPDQPGQADQPGQPGRPGQRQPVRLARRHGRAAAVNVTVAASTLFGADDQPAWLDGFGPITAQASRRISTEGPWRRLLTDPATRELLEYGRTTYHPPRHLAAFVTARDRTCRLPTCERPATDADIDHKRPYHQGGTTGATNTWALHQGHHFARTHHGYTIHTDPTGTTWWTTPAGHHYQVHPETIGPLIPRRPTSPADDPAPF